MMLKVDTHYYSSDQISVLHSHFKENPKPGFGKQNDQSDLPQWFFMAKG